MILHCGMDCRGANEEKRTVLHLMDALGVTYIEVGMPLPIRQGPILMVYRKRPVLLNIWIPKRWETNGLL